MIAVGVIAVASLATTAQRASAEPYGGFRPHHHHGVSRAVHYGPRYIPRVERIAYPSPVVATTYVEPTYAPVVERRVYVEPSVRCYEPVVYAAPRVRYVHGGFGCGPYVRPAHYAPRYYAPRGWGFGFGSGWGGGGFGFYYNR